MEAYTLTKTKKKLKSEETSAKKLQKKNDLQSSFS